MNITPCFWATVEASQIDFISLWGGHVHLSQRTGNGAVFSSMEICRVHSLAATFLRHLTDTID